MLASEKSTRTRDIVQWSACLQAWNPRPDLQHCKTKASFGGSLLCQELQLNSILRGGRLEDKRGCRFWIYGEIPNLAVPTKCTPPLLPFHTWNCKVLDGMEQQAIITIAFSSLERSGWSLRSGHHWEVGWNTWGGSGSSAGTPPFWLHQRLCRSQWRLPHAHLRKQWIGF